MISSQRSDAEKNNLIEKGKKIGIDEVIKYNEIINKSQISLKYKTMSSYCLKCRNNTGSINPIVSKSNNSKTMILSKCAICGSKKSRFIKKQEASGILSNLCLRTPVSKVTSLGDILF